MEITGNYGRQSILHWKLWRGGETGMKQGQTLCWCVWCGTELVAGGYCYCLDIGCLCPACLPEYTRVVFRSCLVAVG